MEGIYLIHFDRPYCHARHYLGWSEDIERRIECHRTGNGSPLLAAVTAAGIGWAVVRTWEGATRTQERQLKNSKNVPRQHCPICRAEKEAMDGPDNSPRRPADRPTRSGP